LTDANFSLDKSQRKKKKEKRKRKIFSTIDGAFFLA
jgi:hypothetical protein